mmetsp:Transcript_15751/g.37854  ORF Transcript_15751/g.37854 Transcript_15751/m.37854 type:complete len:213 (+) Transcript_15751:63-701(+)
MPRPPPLAARLLPPPTHQRPPVPLRTEYLSTTGHHSPGIGRIHIAAGVRRHRFGPRSFHKRGGVCVRRRCASRRFRIVVVIVGRGRHRLLLLLLPPQGIRRGRRSQGQIQIPQSRRGREGLPQGPLRVLLRHHRHRNRRQDVLHRRGAIDEERPHGRVRGGDTGAHRDDDTVHAHGIGTAVAHAEEVHAHYRRGAVFVLWGEAPGRLAKDGG